MTWHTAAQGYITLPSQPMDSILKVGLVPLLLLFVCLHLHFYSLLLIFFVFVYVCVQLFFFFKASMTGSQEMMKALSHLVCAEGLGTRGSGRKMWQKSSCFLIFLFMSFALPVFWDWLQVETAMFTNF